MLTPRVKSSCASVRTRLGNSGNATSPSGPWSATRAAHDSIERDLVSRGRAGQPEPGDRDVARLAALRVMVRGWLTRDDRAGLPRHGAREQEASKRTLPGSEAASALLTTPASATRAIGRGSRIRLRGGTAPEPRPVELGFNRRSYL